MLPRLPPAACRLTHSLARPRAPRTAWPRATLDPSPTPAPTPTRDPVALQGAKMSTYLLEKSRVTHVGEGALPHLSRMSPYVSPISPLSPLCRPA